MKHFTVHIGVDTRPPLNSLAAPGGPVGSRYLPTDLPVAEYRHISVMPLGGSINTSTPDPSEEVPYVDARAGRATNRLRIRDARTPAF